MAQDSVSIEGSKFVKPAVQGWRRGGLKWKISATFSGLIFVLGLLVIGIVYVFTGNALQKQVDLRSAAIATNLADASAGFVSRKSTLELDALVAKYGRLDGVAYAFVQDAKGEVLASSVQPFPAELKEAVGSAAPSKTTALRGKSVVETRSPVLDGQLGVVRVGLWAEADARRHAHHPAADCRSHFCLPGHRRRPFHHARESYHQTDPGIENHRR